MNLSENKTLCNHNVTVKVIVKIKFYGAILRLSVKYVFQHELDDKKKKTIHNMVVVEMKTLIYIDVTTPYNKSI